MIDCHCHLPFVKKSEWGSLEKSSIDQWVMGGYEPKEWDVQLQLKDQFPGKIKTCFGLHPWYVRSDQFELDCDFDLLKEKVFDADLIGEVGLDFFERDGDLKKELQISVFEKQLEMSTGQPFVFHIVKAHGKALEILNDHPVKGFVHSFSGAPEVASSYLDLGLLLSFSPAILNENNKKARAALEVTPVEKLLIESDSPSGPESDEYSQQSLLNVAGEVAKIKGVGLEDLYKQVELNFQTLF